MNGSVQYLLVGFIVAAAACYAVWNIAGAAARHRWSSWVLLHAPQQGWLHELLQRQVLRQREKMHGGGCGSCSSHPQSKPPKL